MRGEVQPPVPKEPKAKVQTRKRKRGKQAEEPTAKPSGENGKDQNGDADVPDAHGDGGDVPAAPGAEGDEETESKTKSKTPKVTPGQILEKWKLQDHMGEDKIQCVVMFQKKGVVYHLNTHSYKSKSISLDITYTITYI